ncbi:hypothetical protein C1G86_0060 [Dehalococcoides mccartyi]|uniref:Uncharacterized protein n=1 Tax=Dehalococcoides mccartyi TaxID=61435 RepID=A0A328ER05_9CHLR|nr:hypothetical protein C1G87_0094 [Dehalococcoides mccartyi]RAL71120.1 hypothetical protein C1G86_0060 [Dehalococcoides mccartyi]
MYLCWWDSGGETKIFNSPLIHLNIKAPPEAGLFLVKPRVINV